MVPQHQNKAFIFLLSNSGQSQLHFSTKFIFLGACVAKIWLNFTGKSRKLIFLQKTLKPPQKGNIFAFIKVPRKF